MSPGVDLFLKINGFVGQVPWIDRFMAFVVNDYFMLLVLSLTLAGLWFWGAAAPRDKRQRAVLAGALGLGLASLAVVGLNQVSPWPRPFNAGHTVHLLFYPPTDPSFPSNAATAAFALATGAFLAWRWAGLGAYLLAALYAFSRVYTGVHYPVDVLGGAIVGSLSTVAALGIIRLADPLVKRLLAWARLLYLA